MKTSDIQKIVRRAMQHSLPSDVFQAHMSAWPDMVDAVAKDVSEGLSVRLNRPVVTLTTDALVQLLREAGFYVQPRTSPPVMGGAAEPPFVVLVPDTEVDITILALGFADRLFKHLLDTLPEAVLKDEGPT